MRGTRKRFVWGAVVALLLAVPFAGSAGAKGFATYEVTITVLTSGQPLTPPVIATHNGGTHVFQVGRAAGFEVKEVAENGNIAPLIAALESDKHVLDVEAGTTPLVPGGLPGSAVFPDSVTLMIDASSDAKYLSWQSMLICTNDGFTGLDRVALPRAVGEAVTFHTAGYDAGTEINTEDFADIVPPCQGLVGVSSGEAGTGMSDPALAEGGVIHHHAGIQGGSDLLPEVHGWIDPAAEVVVERIS